ncbi:MAG: glycosyltransferase family 4 protein [Candidatus Atribacteria bacterium]|nr:glycosyltransferase family 4 protein [Candidatus Atribacteria bacterium]
MGIKSGCVLKRVLVTVFFPKHVGGLQTHFDLLIQNLPSTGLEVVPLQRNGVRLNFGRKALYAIRSGLSRERATAQWISQQIPAFSGLLHRAILEKRVELLHCHDVFSAYCVQDVNLPLVLTIHGPLHLEYKMLGWKNGKALQWVYSVEKSSYERADEIVTVDSGLKDYVVREFGIDPEKIHIVRNAVDVEKVLSLSQKSCGLCGEMKAPFALVPRRLVPKNGVAVAVNAMRFLKEQPFKLVIAGDGPERNRIISLLRKYDLEGKVVLLGEVPNEEVLSLMRQSFAVVVPSVPSEGVIEATSLAALEAMALGKVVVASNIGGLRELIDDSIDGFLFEAGNENYLANILTKVFEDEQLRNYIGSNAQRKVLADYVTQAWLHKILEVYREAYERFDR